MDIIEKVTVVYVPLEDCLRLSVQTKEAESYVLWVTARLAVAVVAAIIKTFTKVTVIQQRQEQISYHQWEQSSALHKLKATPSVAVCNSRETLVQAIDVSLRVDSYFLTFHGENVAARLQLTSLQMRQWLQIVYSQFQKGRWPMAVWPSWVNLQERTDKSLQSNALH